MDKHAPLMGADRREAAGRGLRWHGHRLRLLLLVAGSLVVLLGILLFGLQYWTVGRFLIETDDAYVDANSVIVSPKVSGYIAEVAVGDNQTVQFGELLARIDPRDYQTALDSAQAAVAAQAAAIDDLSQQVGEQQLLVRQAAATLAADRAAFEYASQEYQRYMSLSRTGAATVQNAQQATSTIRQAQAALDRDSAAVDAAQKQVSVLQAQLTQAQALLKQRAAEARQAQLNLGYTEITAAIPGTVGVRTVRVGQYVQAGTQMMALVPLTRVYVTANYKETQLTNVKPGQKVSIVVDTFPDKIVHGWVDSIAPASGAQFALLPPDNATGNFTKIVQRVPVKIRIDPNDPLIGALRPGMSVEPSIDTRGS